MSATQQEIRERYRAIVLDWEAARDDPRRANRIFKKHHAFYKEIRDLEAGRQALEALLADPEPAVRLLAATHSLRLVPAQAQEVLADLEQGPGVYAIDAKYTLINYHSGRLDLDW